VRNQVIFGGVSQHAQTETLKRKSTDVLIATPGRLLDLMQQGFISLKDISIFVLDEADRMLDMGFIHDVKKIIAKLPTKRQTLFFSATMPDEISDLANSILTEPMRVEVSPVSSTAEKVSQKVYFVEKNNKRHLLAHLLMDMSIKSALVFTRTKHGANRVAADLVKSFIKAEAIHGNKSQNARQSALQSFKSGRLRVLVATDIAARGIDIDELSHVFNFDLPNIPETYVHRIGRTGRAGASGIAISFCEAEELPYLSDIQKLIGQQVPAEREQPFDAGYEAPVLGQKLGKKPISQPKPPQNQPRQQQNQPRDQFRSPLNKPAQRSAAPHGKPAQPAQKPTAQPQNQGRPVTAAQPQQTKSGQQPSSNNRPQNGQNTGGQQQGQQQPAQGQGQRPTQNRPQQGMPRQQPPSNQQRPQPKQDRNASNNSSLPTQRGGRFSSILEVAAIEKQDRPPRPKTDYRDKKK
jgi:ATP-dependent RNA helicase RhlE